MYVDVCAIQVTQHARIWPLYIAFIKSHDLPETTVRVYRRMLKLDPDCAEDYIEYLISIGRLDDAAVKLAEVGGQTRISLSQSFSFFL